MKIQATRLAHYPATRCLPFRSFGTTDYLSHPYQQKKQRWRDRHRVTDPDRIRTLQKVKKRAKEDVVWMSKNTREAWKEGNNAWFLTAFKRAPTREQCTACASSSSSLPSPSSSSNGKHVPMPESRELASRKTGSRKGEVGGNIEMAIKYTLWN